MWTSNQIKIKIIYEQGSVSHSDNARKFVCDTFYIKVDWIYDLCLYIYIYTIVMLLAYSFTILAVLVGDNFIKFQVATVI